MGSLLESGVASPSSGVRVISLTLSLRVAVPPLFVSSMPKRAVGFSFESGVSGGVTGACLVAATPVLGWFLYEVVGPLGPVLSLWLLGGTGVIMLWGAARGLAFIKPPCKCCRLFPIVEEHEALHIGGIESDAEIWAAVKGKYSFEALSLGTDPKICSFCPVAKHLKGT